jgi:hypothetical protein
MLKFLLFSGNYRLAIWFVLRFYLTLERIQDLVDRCIYWLNQFINILFLLSLPIWNKSIDQLYIRPDLFHFLIHPTWYPTFTWILQLNKDWVQHNEKLSHFLFNFLLKIDLIMVMPLNLWHCLSYHFFRIKLCHLVETFPFLCVI